MPFWLPRETGRSRAGARRARALLAPARRLAWRWTAGATHTLLGTKAPTVANRTKAVSKLTQRQLEEFTTKKELRCIHGRISNRAQTALRVRFLNGCSEGMLAELAAFESKRALLGRAHTESPLTQQLLVGTKALCKDEAEPWKTDAWQVELVTLFAERFFRYDKPKPFESAAVWAHVARVTRGLLKAMDEFIATCRSAIMPKALARRGELLAGAFDTQLDQFSRDLLKLGLDEAEIPAAQFPRLPLFSEMQIWQAAIYIPAPPPADPADSAQSAQAMATATAEAGAAVLEKVEAVREQWTTLGKEDQERSVQELNLIYQAALNDKREAAACDLALQALQKIKIFKSADECKLFLMQVGQVARLIILDLSHDESTQYAAGRHGEFSRRYGKTKPLSKGLKRRLTHAVCAPPKEAFSQLLLRTGLDHALDVRHEFPHRNAFVVPLSCTAKEMGYFSRPGYKPFLTEGQTEVRYEYHTVGRRGTLPAAFKEGEEEEDDDDEAVMALELEESDDEGTPQFCRPKEPTTQPRLAKEAHFKVEDKGVEKIYRRTQVGHHTATEAAKVVLSSRTTGPTATEVCVVVVTGTAEAAVGALQFFDKVYIIDLTQDMLRGVEDQWDYWARVLSPTYLPASCQDAKTDAGRDQEYFIENGGALAMRPRQAANLKRAHESVPFVAESERKKRKTVTTRKKKQKDADQFRAMTKKQLRDAVRAADAKLQAYARSMHKEALEDGRADGLEE